MRRVSIITWAAAVLLPTVAAAQEAVELSDTQRSYNEQGVAAIVDGDFDSAIRKFQSSLAIGPANITYLNLGRAYQRAGACKDAKEAYAAAAAAPAVPAPTRDEILGVLAKYGGELPDQCPVRLEVVCDDPLTQVTLDGEAPRACADGVAFETAPGDHTVTATLGERGFEKKLNTSEGETVEVAIAFPRDEPAVTAEPVEGTTTQSDLAVTTPERSGNGLATVGLVTAIAGGATLATGLVLEFVNVKPKVEDCNDDSLATPCDRGAAQSAQRTNMVLYGVGAGLAGIGTVLWLLAAPGDSTVSLNWHDGPGLALGGRF